MSNTSKSLECDKVRRLKDIEMFYEIAQSKFNFMISGYWLKLRSDKQIDEKTVLQTLKLLYRHSDNLSLCIKEDAEGVYWYCRMQKEIIDFQILGHEEDIYNVMEREQCNNFNSTEGPLWRVKMTLSVKLPCKLENIADKTDIHENDFMYSNDILLFFHHGITDGSTSMRVCQGFIQILSDVLAGEEKDVYDCFGKFGNGDETDRLIQERRMFLEQNPKIYDMLKTEMKHISSQRIFLIDTFPVPDGITNITKQINRNLSLEDTSKLINIFKSEKISFNSGFTAVANWALIELFVENGFSGDHLDIGAFHAINVRQYWREDSSSEFIQGVHICPLRMLIKTDRKVADKFWSYARDIHNQFKGFISLQRPFDEIIAYPLCSDSGSLDYAQLFSNPPPLLQYFSMSNMGDLRSLFPGTSDHVVVDWFRRGNSCHNMNISMIHIFQTFRGRFLYGMDYATRYVSDDLANKYVDKIFEKFAYLISSNKNSCKT